MKSTIFACFVLIAIFLGCSKFELDDSSYERAALDTIKFVYSVEEQFKFKYGTYTTLEELGKKDIIDPALASGTKFGHNFQLLLLNDKKSFVLYVTPQANIGKNLKSFLITEDGIIRGAYRNKKPCCSMNDPPVAKVIMTKEGFELQFIDTESSHNNDVKSK